MSDSTGLLLKFEEKQIALFNTGKKHAGENLEKLLSQRAKDRSPPIQMSNALSRNVPKEVKTILTNCNVHARRKLWRFLMPIRMVYCCLFMLCIMVRRHTRPIRALVLPIRPCGPSRTPMPTGAISGLSIVHDPIPHRNETEDTESAPAMSPVD